MARRIAQEHGGSLTVTSVPGKGSRFSLAVPMAPIST
jgi:signal transduction histidine kinase